MVWRQLETVRKLIMWPNFVRLLKWRCQISELSPLLSAILHNNSKVTWIESLLRWIMKLLENSRDCPRTKESSRSSAGIDKKQDLTFFKVKLYSEKKLLPCWPLVNVWQFKKNSFYFEKNILFLKKLLWFLNYTFSF